MKKNMHPPQRVLVAQALLRAADALEAVARRRDDENEDKGDDEIDMDHDVPDEPEEDDLTTTDHSEFYQNGKLVFTVDPESSPREMWQTVEKYMNRKNHFPNVWFVSDHGNAHLLKKK